jgi:hypothetical protein
VSAISRTGFQPKETQHDTQYNKNEIITIIALIVKQGERTAAVVGSDRRQDDEAERLARWGHAEEVLKQNKKRREKRVN